MIEIHKKSIFSNTYIATENRRPLAEFSRSLWRQKAELNYANEQFTLTRSGVLTSTFQLLKNDQLMMEISQPSSLKSRLEFHYQDKEYTITSLAWHSTSYVISHKDKEVGRITARGWFKSGAKVVNSDNFSVPIKLFLAWVAMVRWDDNNNAAGAGS